MHNFLVTFQNGLPIWQGLIDEELGPQTGQMRGFEEIKGACLTSVGGGVVLELSAADVKHCRNGKINLITNEKNPRHVQIT